MKALTAVILSVVFLLAAAVAQSGGGAAGNASGQGSTSATQGAQAQANTSAQAAAEAPAVPSGTRIPAVLTKSVDAKKAKQGDPVEAKTSEKLQLGSGTSLPKGTKLVGHVTEAKAKAKDKGESQSLLGIMFDKAVLKGGQEVPMHAIIQAAAALQQSSSLPDTMGSAGPGASAGGPYGGAQGGMGPAGAPGGPGGVSATMGPPAGPRTGGVDEMPVGSQGGASRPAVGVSGIPGVALSPELSNTNNGSVFVSNTRSVKLDSGTELVLRTIPQ